MVFVAAVEILINGAPLARRADVMRDLIDVSISDDLDMSSVFTIRLHSWDNDRSRVTWADRDLFAIGSRVEVRLGYAGAALAPVIAGEITDLGVDFGADRTPVLTVTGRDFRHRLALGPKTLPYENQTNSEIAYRVVSRNNLTPDFSSTVEGQRRKQQETQYQETDLEFLVRLAKEEGYEVLVKLDKVYFGPPRDAAPAVQLRIGNDQVTEFNAAVNGTSPITAVQVEGMDDRQQTFTQEATTAQIPGLLRFDTLRRQTVIATERPATTVAEAVETAQAELDAHVSRFLSGSGTCRGDTRLKVGGRVRLVGVGDRLSREYRLTGVSHSYSTTGLFTTSFQVNGAPRPDTAAESALAPNASPVARRTRVSGVCTATVADIKDPMNLARVRVKFPWDQDAGLSAWAPVATSMVGNQWGQFFPPQVDDKVLVMFDRGEFDKPYVVGSVWSAKNAPPQLEGKQLGDVRVLRSRSGHTVMLDDTKDAETITIEDKNQNQIVIDTKNNVVTVKSVNGRVSVEAKNVAIKADEQLTIDAKDLKISGSSSIAVSGTTNFNSGALVIQP